MILRRAAGVVLVIALGFVPLLPTEHVHEMTDADGHHEVVAHRHAALHVLEETQDADGTTVDHADGTILSLDDAYTAPTVYVNHAPAVAVARLVFESDAGVVRAGRPFSDPPAHGPPRAPTGLRAPPALLS